MSGRLGPLAVDVRRRTPRLLVTLALTKRYWIGASVNIEGPCWWLPQIHRRYRGVMVGWLLVGIAFMWMDRDDTNDPTLVGPVHVETVAADDTPNEIDALIERLDDGLLTIIAMRDENRRLVGWNIENGERWITHEDPSLEAALRAAVEALDRPCSCAQGDWGVTFDPSCPRHGGT